MERSIDSLFHDLHFVVVIYHYPLFSCESSILVSVTSFLRTRVQSHRLCSGPKDRKNRRGGLIATKVVR